jgi:hypothetical protein
MRLPPPDSASSWITCTPPVGTFARSKGPPYYVRLHGMVLCSLAPSRPFSALALSINYWSSSCTAPAKSPIETLAHPYLGRRLPTPSSRLAFRFVPQTRSTAKLPNSSENVNHWNARIYVNGICDLFWQETHFRRYLLHYRLLLGSATGSADRVEWESIYRRARVSR